ncbi:MAG: DnaJ C-terminal domain-containing protein [Paracoccaceae bacterium]|nr:DnaJ C-terminal domain-containing protein [Paracoccaceae bacterium]
MDFKDYYRILDVTQDADASTIKKAFRKAARKYHPDVNTDAGAEAKFKDVTEAYEVLNDPERRAAYDQLGPGQQHSQGHYQPPPDWSEEFAFSDASAQGQEPFSDFFETLFRRGAGSGEGMHHRQGADSHGRIEISIEDSYRGAERTLSLRAPVLGRDGQITLQDRSISVHVPKGIGAGQHIRLAGQGQAGEAGAGDLFLEVTFAPHPVFVPDGKDLYLELPIAPWEAALGGHVVMPTPDGKVDLRIPKNARTGQKMRLKGKGLPGQPAGDIYATLKIINPKVETEEARAFFRQMAETLPFDPRAHLGD